MNSSVEDQNCVLIRENTKLKEQIEIKNRELDKLEHVLLANLAHKEQEIADLSAQVDDMKATSNPCNQQLRCMGLDPAVNAVFLRIKKDMKAANEKLEQTQNDLQAWKFTPDSQTGKRMMTRMRVLLQENEELGKMNQSGRTAKLESEIAMKRTLIEELKQTNSEYENVIDEMDTETDCFQTSIFMLQQQLGLARTTISSLCTELESLSPGRSQNILVQCNWVDSVPSMSKADEMDVDSNGSFSHTNHIDVVNDNTTVTRHSQDHHHHNQHILTTSKSSLSSSIHNDDRTNSSAVTIIHNTDSSSTVPVDLKSEAIDNSSDSQQKIVNKNHPIKSNSSSASINQKKKLTS